MDSHHLKLYSEYWTTRGEDGENRVSPGIVMDYSLL
jgi:hypothetical protein